MKNKIFALGVVALIVGGVFAVFNLQLEETTVSARYDMLACEDCYYMTIEKSKDGHLDGETIIPTSNTINIEQLIDSIAITRDTLCLRGKPYRFNWNIFGINPDGKRFEVIEKVSLLDCSNF
ncbi:hypothetical protein CYL31_03515 [Marinomonas sp. A3A]|jgi:hypothetical protein|uniref:hypothetical protein n=1 Tax=Marinomonas sp. A3A TaxID=2065312 RepID=UPI001BB3BFF2|nr:hypothetical protein [Marinomonas sp. A3A]QUX90526.1 hypothetical protein CYL31_03515 [Marinomonas sp. A3A]